MLRTRSQICRPRREPWAGDGAGWVKEQLAELLVEVGTGVSDVRGVAFGIAAPVEWTTGRPVLPPIMPGWDAYPVPDRLRYTVPIGVSPLR